MDRPRSRDYSLVGRDGARAVEKGLADAQWYATPIPKEQMRALLERSDHPAVRDTLLWFALLFTFGAAGFLLWGSWLAILPFAVYGVLYASVSDSRWHESSHGTAFKTDWMNNALYEVASFMVMREAVIWRWSHARHHSDTIIVGRDLEIAVQRPAKLFVLLQNFFAVPAFRKYVNGLFLHALGRLTPEEPTYIPEQEHGKIFARARIHLLIYAGVIGLSIYLGSLLPLMYVGLVNFYGAWLGVVYGYTQHAGLADDVLDHRLNTRTVYMNPVNRYLYWNMGYHIEHHMFPLVPFHALPKLHALIKDDLPTPSHGLLEAYRELIPAVLRQVKEPDYYIQRKLPSPAGGAARTEAAPALAAEERRVVDGWVEVGEGALLRNEDVLRFDHENQTFAVYRTAQGELYATEGRCTHGNAHLADGFLKGALIECGKHNGRFDIRDGSPQRLPVCVGLKTYPVRERDGKLLLNLAAAGGYGVTQAPRPLAFRVVSNENVATFIKELVLEPLEASTGLEYRPGDYLQIEIPAYALRSLRAVRVGEPFAATWEALGVFGVTASNPAPTRRSYSMASTPGEGKRLRFNIRLATPPPGAACGAGVGSAYLFGLEPGEVIHAIGPYGEFHVKETPRELVYLGGGSGMAPLRAHLVELLGTRKVTTPVSYWFGARARQDLFYQDEFAALAKKSPNFRFQVALSEPTPSDRWAGSTGFIHEVLRREYLESHPNPKNIEYFLCGPPAMIQAARDMLSELGVDPGQVHFDEF